MTCSKSCRLKQFNTNRTLKASVPSYCLFCDQPQFIINLSHIIMIDRLACQEMERPHGSEVNHRSECGPRSVFLNSLMRELQMPKCQPTRVSQEQLRTQGLSKMITMNNKQLFSVFKFLCDISLNFSWQSYHCVPVQHLPVLASINY